MSICIFGDSIAYGASDLEKGGWVNRARLYLENEDFDGVVYNLSIAGNNSEGVLARFEHESKLRDPEMLVFAVGINDSQFVISSNEHRNSVEKFEQNIKEIITKAGKITDKIIFIGLTPVDEVKTVPIPLNTDNMYKNKYIEKYNENIKAVCAKEKIEFIDLFSKMKKLDYKEMLEDGLHPNSKGHKWIAGEVIKRVKSFESNI